jgi:hypothetical protein
MPVFGAIDGTDKTHEAPDQSGSLDAPHGLDGLARGCARPAHVPPLQAFLPVNFGPQVLVL